MPFSKNIALIIATILLLVAIPATILLVRQQQSLRSKADVNTVTLSVSPVSNNVPINSEFNVDVRINAGAFDIGFIDLPIQYNKQILNVVSFEDLSHFTNVLTNEFANNPNNQTGNFRYVVADQSSATTHTGVFDVVRIRFKAVGVGNSAVTFGSATEITAAGQSTALATSGNIEGDYTVNLGNDIATPPITQSPTINGISVNLFWDYDYNTSLTTNKNGRRDANEPSYAEGPRSLGSGVVNLKDSNNVTISPSSRTPSGHVTFSGLNPGRYTILVSGLFDSLEVTNPAALTVDLQSGSDRNIDLGLAPTDNIPRVVNGGLSDPGGSMGGFVSNVNVGGNAQFNANVTYGYPVKSLEFIRVRNQGDLTNPANWFKFDNTNCNAVNATCQASWTPTPADIGPWYVYININSYNGKRCTGNPQVASLTGFLDCSSIDNYQDAVPLMVNAAVSSPAPLSLPNKVRVFNAPSVGRCDKGVEASDHILDYLTPGGNYTQINDWDLTEGLPGFGNKIICAQFGYQALGSSNITWYPNIISQTVSYVAPASPTQTQQPTINNLTAHIFYDANRNGTQDNNELNVQEIYGKLTGPVTRDQLTCCPSDINGDIHFNTLTSGIYTISLYLRDIWEVTNPQRLTVQLLPNQNATTNIGIMVKSTYNIPARTGQIWGPTEYRFGSSYPAGYMKYKAETGKLLFGKLEIFRVRKNDAAYIANPNNWIRINIEGGNGIADYSHPEYVGCNFYGTNWQGLPEFDRSCKGDSVEWIPNSSEAGSWLVFINVTDLSNGTKCTGNPYWNNITGYADCTGQDVVETNVVGQGGVSTPVPTINLCPANATTCWRDFGQTCTNPGTADAHCSSLRGAGSTCDHDTPGVFGDGCTTPTCGAGQTFCSRLLRCTTALECNPQTTVVPTEPSCRQSNGDANEDGRVNGIDFTIWSNEFLGSIVNQADFNCDGRVNGIDFTIWSNEFLRQ